MYKVIKFFTDIHDNDYPYSVGDIFPREGISVTNGRLAELAGSNNKQGTPLIQFEEEPQTIEEEPKKPAAKRAKKTAEK